MNLFFAVEINSSLIFWGHFSTVSSCTLSCQREAGHQQFTWAREGEFYSLMNSTGTVGFISLISASAVVVVKNVM